MGNINLLEIFALILTISVSSSFILRKIGNETLQQQQEKGADIYSRIYRGNVSRHGDFPYQVGLRIMHANRPIEICGGSLITVNYVLTAAQCVDSAQHIMVYLGGTIFFTSTVQYDIGMDNVRIHSDYVKDWSQNNIAVINIPTVTLSFAISTIPLPLNYGKLPSYAGAETVLAGWGQTLNPHENPRELRFTALQVIPNWKCARYQQYMDDTKLCTGANGRSGYHGDAGSPLVLGNRSHHIYQIGIFTTEGCYINKPNVFTRIDHHYKWIKDNTDLN